VANLFSTFFNTRHPRSVSPAAFRTRGSESDFTNLDSVPNLKDLTFNWKTSEIKRVKNH